MEAGRMRERVTFMRTNNNVRDAGGNPTPSYMDTETRWATVRPMSSTERMRGSETLNEISHSITLRYTDDLQAVDYLEWNGKRLDIQSLIPDPKRTMVTALCIEQEPE